METLELSKDAFEAMSSMESRVAILIKALVEEEIDKDSLIDKEERIKLAEKIGKSPRTILTYFNFLENEGYAVAIISGRTKVFKLLTSPKEIAKRVVSLSSTLEQRDALKLFMTIEAREYLTELCDVKGISKEEKEALLSHFPI